MAKALTYKKSTTTTLKAVGILNKNDGTINLDGKDVKVIDLLSDFDNEIIELNIKIKEDTELELGSDTDEDQDGY